MEGRLKMPHICLSTGDDYAATLLVNKSVRWAPAVNERSLPAGNN